MKKPQSFIKKIFVLTCTIYSVFLFCSPVYSQTASEIEDQINQKAEEIKQKQSVLSTIEARIKEISSSNNTVSQKIALINAEITGLDEKIQANKSAIEQKLTEIQNKQDLLNKKKALLDEIASDLYRNSRFRISSFLLSNEGWDDMVQGIFVKKNTISTLKDEIEEINGEFYDLSDAKAALDKEKTELENQKADLDKSYSLLAEEKARLQKELNSQTTQKKTLNAQIGGITKELSDLQNFLLIVKSGGTIVDANSLVSTSSKGSLAYFKANAPIGKRSFAIFSFGAYTHRNGMSQWGAKARAEIGGQNYTQILNAYYPGKNLVTGSVKISGNTETISSTISVDGYGTLSFEDYYLLGIKEVPESWSPEVLKAQAIAARTYAIRYTNNGRKAICTTQSCQVFSTPLKTGAWKDAVLATRGVILTNSDGTPASTQYAAVHGGWVNGVGYDVRSSGAWISEAWDNLSGVTWFYRNWYDYNGSTYNPCSSHPNPWLTEEEMADILNAYKYWIQKGSPASDSRMIALDTKACWGKSANPYSMSELRSLVTNPVTSISNVYTTNTNGYTTGITFVTNAGSLSINGTSNVEGFKKLFQMRAPGFFNIPQSGFTHINIEIAKK